MLKKPTSIDIDKREIVTMEQVEKADRLWDNPEMVMRLIDLMFLNQDTGKDIPS